MHKITDEMFKSAWGNNDNRRIMNKVCRRYKGQISEEELVFRSYMALFYCLQKHNPSENTKFTSSLYRHTVWQCHKALREDKRHPQLPSLPNDNNVVIIRPEIFYVRDCLDVLPKKHANILQSYYFYNMTLKEIGDINGYTPPAAMQKLRQAEAAFRKLYGED